MHYSANTQAETVIRKVLENGPRKRAELVAAVTAVLPHTTDPAMSSHLRRMRDAGVIRRASGYTVYELGDKEGKKGLAVKGGAR